MAKKAYVGVANSPKNVKTIYVGGIDGRPKRVIKGYVGDAAGHPKLFWPPQNKPWNPYHGTRLIFDEDYEIGHTYSKYKAEIGETVRYFIGKIVHFNRGTYDDFMDILESKTEKIVEQVVTYAGSNRDIVSITASISESFDSITFRFYVGKALNGNIRILSTYYKTYTYHGYTGSTNNDTFTAYLTYTIYNDGREHEVGTASQGTFTRWIGAIDDVQSPDKIYLSGLTNIGIHFEEFNSGDIVANWDFTSQSGYNDTIEGLRCIYGSGTNPGGGTYLDSDGLHFPNYQNQMEVPGWFIRYANTFEMEIGNYNISNLDADMFYCSGTILFQYDLEEDYWKFFYYESGVLLQEENTFFDIDFFKNCILKVHYDEDGYITLYKNNIQVYRTQTIKVTSLVKRTINIGIFNHISGTIKTLKFFNE